MEPHPLVRAAIAHAAASGGLRAGARKYPEAARGLLKAADFHSARCNVLISEFAGTGRAMGSFKPAPITRPDWMG